MTGNTPRTQPRDRQLGARLRAIRKLRTGFSLEKAAKLLQWSPAKMSRFENGKCQIAPNDVATVAATYRLSVPERNELIRYAQYGDTTVWWDPPLDDLPDVIGATAAFLDEASTVTDWSATLVPSLLQIEGYAKAFLRSAGRTPEQAQAHWEARRLSQLTLGRFDYTAFICENVLRRPFGGPEVHSEQLRHLAGVRERGIGVRVLRGQLPVGTLLHGWQHMTFPSAAPVVNVEAVEGRFYFHAQKAAVFGQQITMLEQHAYSVDDSNALLRQLAGTRNRRVPTRS